VKKTSRKPPQRPPSSVKKEVKEEIKQEVKAKLGPAISTPKAVAAPKRPRAVSAEMSIRKCPRATATRAARRADDDELLSVQEIIASAEAKASNAGEGGGEGHEGGDEAGEGEEVTTQ
jgi:hypothetical protein